MGLVPLSLSSPPAALRPLMFPEVCQDVVLCPVAAPERCPKPPLQMEWTSSGKKRARESCGEQAACGRAGGESLRRSLWHRKGDTQLRAAGRVPSFPSLSKQGSSLLPSSHPWCVWTSNSVGTGKVFRNPSKNVLV